MTFTLMSFKNDVQQLSETEFVEAHPYAVLCRVSDASKTPVDADHSRRGTARPVGPTVAEPTGDGLHTHAPHWAVEVSPIQKTSSSPFETQVSIGRSSSSDIVVVGTRVSKRHAYVLTPPLATSPDARWQLVDARSRNGTRLNSMPLETGEKRMLKDGDVVGIGGSRLRFFGPFALHSLLRYWVLET